MLFFMGKGQLFAAGDLSVYKNAVFFSGALELVGGKEDISCFPAVSWLRDLPWGTALNPGYYDGLHRPDGPPRVVVE